MLAWKKNRCKINTQVKNVFVFQKNKIKIKNVSLLLKKKSSTCFIKLAYLPYYGTSWKFGNNKKECICLLEIFSFYFLIYVNGRCKSIC